MNKSLADKIRAAKTNYRQERATLQAEGVYILDALLVKLLDNPLAFATYNLPEISYLYPKLHFWLANDKDAKANPYPVGSAATCLKCGHIHNYILRGQYALSECYLCDTGWDKETSKRFHRASVLNGMLRTMPRERFDLIDRLRRKPNGQ